MTTAFFGGAFFGGEFFNTPAIKTGTGGIDPKKGKKLNLPFKPTGLSVKKRGQKTENQSIISERLNEQELLAAEFTSKVTRETTPVEQLSLADIDLEIGTILRKKLKTDEENNRIAMLLILLAANL